jgi:hypothetical protein
MVFPGDVGGDRRLQAAFAELLEESGPEDGILDRAVPREMSGSLWPPL